MFEVTIHIPGLKELAEAISTVANKGVQPVANSQAVVNTSLQVPVESTTPVNVSQVPVDITQPPVQQVAPTQAQVQVQQQMPVQNTVVQSVPTQQAPVQTTTQTYVLDDLARAAMTLMDAGKQQDLLQLLNQFGVEALPALPQEQYGTFATALRGMGAQI